jgi:hypothetical protein
MSNLFLVTGHEQLVQIVKFRLAVSSQTCLNWLEASQLPYCTTDDWEWLPHFFLLQSRRNDFQMQLPQNKLYSESHNRQQHTHWNLHHQIFNKQGHIWSTCQSTKSNHQLSYLVHLITFGDVCPTLAADSRFSGIATKLGYLLELDLHTLWYSHWQHQHHLNVQFGMAYVQMVQSHHKGLCWPQRNPKEVARGLRRYSIKIKHNDRVWGPGA